MYKQDFIDKVRDASSIVELISEHTSLKKSGSGLLGLCPFPSHSEKTPSFSVSELKQAYYCFGCQKSGNIFTFLREMRGFNFPEAVEYLAEKKSIPLPDDVQRPRQTSDDLKKFFRCNQVAKDFYHHRLLNLPSTHPVKSYALKRGLTEEIIKEFGLGYSGSSNELVRYLIEQGLNIKVAEELGLAKPSRDSNAYYDAFRDRVIFPISTHYGQICGFGGRVLDSSLPKYLNSPESPVFSKGRVLYGIAEAAKFVRAEDSVILVEGYMDYLALVGAGIRNVVATLGTAFTRDHAQVIKRVTKNVFVFFDGDQAGVKARFKSLPILLSEGLFARCVEISESKDPDDFVRSQGPEKTLEIIRNSRELFFVFLESLQKKLGREPSEKIHLINEVKPVLAATADSSLRDLYIEELARKLSVQIPWLRSALRTNLEGARVGLQDLEKEPKAAFTSKNMPRPSSSVQLREAIIFESNRSNSLNTSVAKSKPSFPKEERALLNLALWREKFLKEIIRLEVHNSLSDPHIKELFGLVLEGYRQSPKDFDKLTSHLINSLEEGPGSGTGEGSSDNKGSSATKVLGDSKLEAITDHLNPRLFNYDDEVADKMFRDCLIRLREKSFRSRAKDLIRDLKSSQDRSDLEQFVNEIKKRDSDLDVKTPDLNPEEI